MFCNVVYSRLAAGCGEEKDREELDRDLYAPLEGWAKAEDRMWARVLAADDE